MFDSPENRRKKWTLIGAGTIVGGIIGLLFGRVWLGAFLGYMAGIVASEAKYGTTKPTSPEQKKTMRLMVWMVSALVILGAVVYARLSGDLLSGLGGGIGLVFSVGLGFGSMYDERMGQVFNKAARNAFVALLGAMSVVGFMDEAMWIAVPELMSFLGDTPILPLMWMSYAVFAFSWLYHAYIRGE